MGKVFKCFKIGLDLVNPLNAELNPICYLLALLGAHHIFHVGGLRIKMAILFNIFLGFVFL